MDRQIDQNSDFYNVTVNFIMKRRGKGGSHAPKELPIQVYENSINEAEKNQQKAAIEAAQQSVDDDSEPKVIMPNDIKTIPKNAEKSVHQLLQESRISKDDDQTEQELVSIENNQE